MCQTNPKRQAFEINNFDYEIFRSVGCFHRIAHCHPPTPVYFIDE